MKRNKVCLGCLRTIAASDKGCPFCGFNPDVIADKKLLPAGIFLCHRYQVGKVLGEGGFGITYTGYDISEKRAVAIKEYFPANMAQRNISQENPYAVIPFDGDNGNAYERGLERFEQEAKVLQKLTKLPHVVKVYDYFLQNNTGYLIMEYVPGRTLREYVKETGVFSVRRMYEVMEPVVQDLSAIHQMGIVHRDISPDNIILQANGIAKVIDFGTARAVFIKEDGTNKTMTVMLRQQYAPKEQYLPNGHIGAWSDVYSLCATMYFMLFGKNPDNVFGREAKDVARAFREGEMLNDSKLCYVLEKGMSVAYQKRYQSMDELRQELKEAVIGREDSRTAQEHTIYIDREQRLPKYMTLSQKRKRWRLAAAVLLAFFSFALILFGADKYGKRKPLPKQTAAVQATATERAVETAYEVSESPDTLVIVPDVYKRTHQEALSLLHSADSDLRIVVKRKYDNRIKKGRVIMQSLAAGQTYHKKGRKQIVLTISKGKRKVSSPHTAAPAKTSSPKSVSNTPVKTPVPKRVSKEPVKTSSFPKIVTPRETKAPAKHIKIITEE